MARPWTVYRSHRDVEAVLGRHAQVEHREFEYCRFRAGDRRLLRAVLRRPAEATFRRLGFEAIEVRMR